MKNTVFLKATAITLISSTLLACSLPHRVSQGNLYENMTIFTLMTLAAFALVAISFNQGKNSSAAQQPQISEGKEWIPCFNAETLTAHPIYVLDSHSSFHAMVFDPDGVFWISPTISTNGVAPKAVPAGRWTLSSDGLIRVVRGSTGNAVSYICLERDREASTARIRSDVNREETWFYGPDGLAGAQAFCFGTAEPPQAP